MSAIIMFASVSPFIDIANDEAFAVLWWMDKFSYTINFLEH